MEALDGVEAFGLGPPIHLVHHVAAGLGAILAAWEVLSPGRANELRDQELKLELYRRQRAEGDSPVGQFRDSGRHDSSRRPEQPSAGFAMRNQPARR